MGNGEEESPRLYNVRILRTCIEYLEKFHPDVRIDEVLQFTGLTRSQLEDDGYWCTQDQVDRYQRIVDKLTRNPEAAREAGRYILFSKAYRPIRQYVVGFISVATAYSLLPKISSKITRAVNVYVNSLKSNDKIEVIVKPLPGVNEKPYQCQNRIGQFETLPMAFSGKYAHIEHPSCVHRGDAECRYIVSWVEPLFLKMRRLRNLLLLYALFPCFILASLPIYPYKIFPLLILLFLVISITVTGWYYEKADYRKQVAEQAQTAELLMVESNIRHNETVLIQEIGQAISSILDIDILLSTIMHILQHRLEFDRGMVFLANNDKSRLVFKAGYGITQEQEDFLRKNEFHLDRPESRGPFVVAFREQKPYLVNDLSKIIDDLSNRSKEFFILSDSSSFISVPITFEGESLGILCVDRQKAASSLKQSDLDLLMGIAPQIAISINNARSYEMYRDLVESANSIIVRIDTQGRIRFVNRYSQEFYGYTEQELIGKEIMGLIIPEKDADGNDLTTPMKRFLENPESYHTGRTENILRNGQHVWVSWSSKPIKDKDGNIIEVLCVGNDITALKQAEEEKKQLEDQLVRAQKMEAIGALAGGVAHDLNNILSGLTSYPELLLMELKDDSPMRKAVLTIKKSGDKAAAIVQDLLTLARRGVNVSNVVDLNVIINDYLESPEFNRLFEYHPLTEFAIKLEPKVKPILGSEVHLAKTLMNLISNAAEAMPNGGKVTVGTEHRYLYRPLRGYDTVARGEYVVLTVEDNGVGISQEDLKRIFEPFFSKKIMGRSGTGLGMTVVWSTVKDHHGYIDVESVEGKGTKFILYFPITNKPIKEDSKLNSIENFSGTESILIVDDSEEQRELTRNILGKLGYKVEIAKSGEEAIMIIKDNPMDLMVLDMIMDTGIDGLDTYKRAQAIYEKQKAIIVSGFSETERVREALKLGVGGYIRKPYALGDLARAVRTELDRR